MNPKLSKTSKILRRSILAVWLVIVIVGIGSYLYNPKAFTAENIAAFLERFQGMIWGIYLLFSIVRGWTLLPSSPLVIAGTILFPSQPFAVLIVSMAGILLSSSMIYFFSEHLGFSEYFEDRKPELMHKVKAKLEHPLGFLFVAVWAFFPVVPTDFVCYVAGTTKMNFPKFIAAVFVGEMVLCSLYIFFARTVSNTLIGYVQ